MERSRAQALYSSAMASCCPPAAAGYLASDHDDAGSVRSIDGISFYQVGSGSNGLLFIPDIWGWNGGRTRALADDLAAKGLSVWVPRVLPPFEEGTDGDGLPPAFDIKERRSVLGSLFQGEWNHSRVVPKVLAVMTAMKNARIRKIGIAGICYGAWIAMHLSKKVDLVGCASPHPSIHIEGMFGGDPAVLASESKCPWALFPAGIACDGGDGDIYDAGGSVMQALEEKFPGKNVSKRFSAMQHGFFTRGAIKEGQTQMGTGPAVQAAVEECMTDICEFFAKRGLLRRDEAGLPPLPVRLKKPKFQNVAEILPITRGLNLMLKAVSCSEKEAGMLWEAVLGDASGVATFTLTSAEHAELCKTGHSVRVQNARVRMTKGFIRIAIDKWAVLKKADSPLNFEPYAEKDISSVEYELAS